MKTVIVQRPPADRQGPDIISPLITSESIAVTGDKPSAFDFKARAKYDAWEARKGMKREFAMKAYVRLVEHLK